ncbi:MAG: serine hydrolase [Ferruginibacter sp.]|nr:serine hydrolase [Ferruginibacter sp.]
MFKKKVSIPVAILMTIAGALITFFSVSWLAPKNPEYEPTVTASPVNTCDRVNMVRLNGYQFIRPLLFAEIPCEAEKLLPVKSAVVDIINSYKSSGTISGASVYLRELSQGNWVSIGEQDTYNPGSLLKVPELITFMKMNEKKPGLLDKKILYSVPLQLKKQAFFLSKSIEVGKTYAIRDLLYYMIAYSDNNATMLLNQMMDLAIFKKLFTDLGLPEPNMTKNDIPIGVKEYSLFMRALYNATYLNIGDSEYCTELLIHRDFNQGLLNGLPGEVKVAHKFGEARDRDGISANFSESGIIYVGSSPYLLTVMIRGKNNVALPPVISMISRKVFEMISRA